MLSLDGELQGTPQTYIVAQNPAVLAQLMRENENRPVNPSAYTTPASVFNTLAVDIDAEKPEPVFHDKPVLPLKTAIMPAKEMLKLDPFADENSSAVGIKDSSRNSIVVDDERLEPISVDPSSFNGYVLSHEAAHSMAQPQPPAFPIPCEIINAHTQQVHLIDPTYNSLKLAKVDEQVQKFSIQQQQQQSVQYIGFFQQNPLQNVQYMSQLPPHNDVAQKSRSLERNAPVNLTYAPRISFLERSQSAIPKQGRSNSLTRQLSSGPVSEMFGPRSASLERSARVTGSVYTHRANSLERKSHQMQNDPISMMGAHRGGSLERNQSFDGTYDVAKVRGYRGGSLERNHPGFAMVSRSASLERNTQYQVYREHFKQQQIQQKTPEAEPFQEEIYDFGGAHVKSCASIALNKSISKGLLPPGTQLPQASTLNPSIHCVPLTSPKNNGLPPPHNLSYSTTQPYLMTTPLKVAPVIHQNSIYTPMYPRMWNQMKPSLSTASHIVYVQKPSANPQQPVPPAYGTSFPYSSLSDDPKTVALNEADPSDCADFVAHDGSVAQVCKRDHFFRLFFFRILCLNFCFYKTALVHMRLPSKELICTSFDLAFI